MSVYNVSSSELQKVYDRLLRVARIVEPGQKKSEKFPEQISQNDLVKRGRFGDVYVEAKDVSGDTQKLRGDQWLKGTYVIARFYDKITDGVIDGKIDASQLSPKVPIETIQSAESWMPTQELLFALSSSFVTFIIGNSFGSGVVLSVEPNPRRGGFDAYVITNAHVLTESTNLTVEHTEKGCRYFPKKGADIVGYADDYYGNRHVFEDTSVFLKVKGVDVALLSIHMEERLLEPVSVEPDLHPHQLRGRKVLVLGTPMGRRGYSLGTIVQLNTKGGKDDPNIGKLQIDAAMNPGQSGGGTFDLHRHTFLGLNQAKSVSVGRQQVDGIGWAYPMAMFGGLLAMTIDIHQKYLERRFELFDSLEEFERYKKARDVRVCSSEEMGEHWDKIKKEYKAKIPDMLQDFYKSGWFFMEEPVVQGMFTTEERARPPFTPPEAKATK